LEVHSSCPIEFHLYFSLAIIVWIFSCF